MDPKERGIHAGRHGPPTSTTIEHPDDKSDLIDSLACTAMEAARGFRFISEIKVGHRHRKDLGDIDALAWSIQQHGLLQAPVITTESVLIAGRRRLAAWEKLFGEARPIPVRILPLLDIVRGEAAENFERKDFTLSEAVAIKRALEPEVKARAHERQAAGGRFKSEASANLAEADRGESREKVAVFTGVKRTTLSKAEAVVKAAEAEPEKYGRLVDAMDRTGRAHGPYRRLQVLRQTEEIRRAPPAIAADGLLERVVIDSPWPAESDAEQEEIDARGRSMRPYPEMSIKSLCAFMAEQVKPRLAENFVVAVWVTNYHMPFAFELLRALGIDRHSSIITWVKDKMGRGHVLRDKTEHCIIAVKGEVLVNLTNETTELRAARRENSRKPDEFYDLFERLFPARRYVEIFSRGGRGPKWDCHGDQVGKFSPREGLSDQQERAKAQEHHQGNDKIRRREKHVADSTTQHNGTRNDRGTSAASKSAQIVTEDDLGIPAFLRRNADNSLVDPEVRP